MNYERLIMASLFGNTPKEKYENLTAIQKTLVKVCYPRRGTDDEKIDAFEIADLVSPHFHNHVTIAENPDLDFRKDC